MIKKWDIIYFIDSSGSNPVAEFLDSLNPKQQAKILRIFMYVKEYGLRAVIPHLRKLSGTPLWEIRILGEDNIRILYVRAEEYSVLVLHVFIKKKQKTPQKEIDIALKRYSEWQNIMVDK